MKNAKTNDLRKLTKEEFVNYAEKYFNDVIFYATFIPYKNVDTDTYNEMCNAIKDINKIYHNAVKEVIKKYGDINYLQVGSGWIIDHSNDYYILASKACREIYKKSLL